MKKSKNHIFFKNPYVPQMVGKLCVWVFKTIFLKLLNHTNICTKFGSFVNRKKMLTLNHPTSGVNWVITICLDNTHYFTL